MAEYYVSKNAQSNGDHEVHEKDCRSLPDPGNRAYLGIFSSCHAALSAARLRYSRVDGCCFCSRECHTT